MVRGLLTVCLLAALAAPAVAGDPIEVSLGWEGGSPVPTLPETLELSFAEGAGIAGPTDAVDPRFGSVPLRAAPRGSVAVAVDLAPGRERVWVDTDCDGDLSDERYVTWRREGLRWFATADVVVDRKGEDVRVPVRMWRGAFRPDDEFVYEATVHRWGATQVGGALVLIALEDADWDLYFDADGPDRAYVDLDGDGSLDARPGSPESVPLGGEVVLGGRRLRVDASKDGARVVLYDPPPADVDVLPPAGARVAPPDEDLDRLFARMTAERRSPPDVRAVTLREIGALGTAEALLLLESVARDDLDLDVREIAAEACGNPAFLGRGDERVVALAGSASTRVAVGALRALHAMGHPGRQDVYVASLGSTSAFVVEEAARHLSAIDSPVARAALVRAVADAPDEGLRRAAYVGARRGPGPVPAKALEAAAAAPSVELRLMALEDAFAQRDGRARQLVHTACAVIAPGDDVRPLLPFLARCGDAACVDALLAFGAERARRATLASIQRMDGSVLSQRLAAGLEDDDPAIRALCAEALALRGDARASGRLEEALECESETFVREALLAALGDLGDVAAIGALERATEQEDGGGPRAFYGALATPWVRGVPEAQAAFRLGLRHEAWKVRVLALETIASVGDPAVLPEVVEALHDEHRLVRVAAAQALGDVRERGSVRALIDTLRVETNQPVRDAIGGALFRLTGVNLYDDLALWERWWKTDGETFRVPSQIPVLPPAAVGGTSAPEPPKFYGIPLETESVVFVIDQSGSMGGGGSPFIAPGSQAGSKWETAVRELLTAVEQLEDGTEVNVVLFETGVRSWRRSPQRLSPSTRSSLKRFLAKLQPGGATNLYDALARALRMDGIETIIVLSDGAPTHGRFVDQASILAAVQDMNRTQGIVIHTVSIGGGSPLMRNIARQNDGEYVTR